MNATHDAWESCKWDFKRGQTDKGEVDFWKKEMKKENPNLIL